MYAPLVVRTVTDRFDADTTDKAHILEVCHRLGFDPAAVTALHVTVESGRIRVQVTRRAGSVGRG